MHAVFAAAFIVLWAATGPIFGFSETWQLVVNTATTIVTFLTVFVLQNSQNRDSAALYVKLDELILTSQAANSFIGNESTDEAELVKQSKILAEDARRAQDKARKVASGLLERRCKIRLPPAPSAGRRLLL